MKVLNTRNLVTVVLCIAASSLTLVAFASDESATAKLEAAKNLFAQRTDLAKVSEGLKLVEDGVKEADSTDIKFDLSILKSRFIYIQGMKAATAPEKVDLFEKAMAAAGEAKAFNPDFAETYYWHAVNLARWGEAKGKMQALFRVKELMAALQAAIDHNARNGDAGESIDGYGPGRIFGRVYYELPGFAGGDINKSLKYLENSYAKGPEHSLNSIYYADTLIKMGKRALAKEVLTKLLAQDAKTLNPDRIPETIEEFETARKTLATL